jgi:hypothetical protein
MNILINYHLENYFLNVEYKFDEFPPKNNFLRKCQTFQ